MIANQSVVQTLIVELEGRSVQLEAQLANAEKRLEQLEKKGTSAGTQIAKGGEAIGQRYAHASLQISQAAEQMARTGKVAGEASRQLLAQGANMAFMFGPQGAIAGGVAITALAVVQLFMRTREEMEETRRKFQEELAKMVKAKDFIGATTKLGELYSGDASAAIGGKGKDESEGAYFGRQFGLTGVRAKLASIDREIASMTEARLQANKNNRSSEFQDQLRLDVEQLHTLKRELPAVLKEIERQYKSASDAIFGKDGTATKPTGGLAAGQNAQVAANAKIEREKLMKDAAEDLAQMEAGIRKSIAGGTQSAVDDAIAALAVFDAQVEAFNRKRTDKSLGPIDFEDERAGFVAKIAKARDDERRALNQKVEEFAGVVTGDAAEAAVRALEKQTAELRKQINETKELTDAERVRLQALITGGEARERERVKALAVTEDIDDLLKRIDAGQEEDPSRALNTAQARLVAVQLTLTKGGAGYRLIEEAILKLQTKRLEIAKQTAVEAKKEGDERRKQLIEQARKLSAIVDGALQLASAFGLVDEASARVLSNIGTIAALLPAALAGGPGALGAQLAVITSAASFASSLFDFGPTAAQQERRRLAEENTAAMIKLANSLSTLNSQLDDERGIFGSKGPSEDLQKLLTKLGKNQPFFAGLAGKDLSNPADREAIRKLIGEAFTAMQGIDPESLSSNGMSGRDLIDAMKQIIALLNALDGQSPTSGTGGYNVSREITEVTGGRLVGLMASSLLFERRTAEGIEAILATVRGSGPIQTPPIADWSPRGVGGITITGDLIIQLTVPPGISGVDARQFGADVGTGIKQSIENIDRGLGGRIRRRDSGLTVRLS